MSDLGKLASASVLALGLAAGVAQASGPVTVFVEDSVVIAPPAVTNWAGFYGGLSYGAVAGDIYEITGGGAFPDLDSDTDFGAFVGYNWQRGNFVFGGEFTYTRVDNPFVGFPASIQDDVYELRARGGYAVNNVLVYGFVGGATSRIVDVGTIYDQTGVSFGLGAAVMLRSRFSVGIEAARRRVSGTTGASTLGSNIDTLMLRGAFHF